MPKIFPDIQNKNILHKLHRLGAIYFKFLMFPQTKETHVEIMNFFILLKNRSDCSNYSMCLVLFTLYNNNSNNKIKIWIKAEGSLFF